MGFHTFKPLLPSYIACLFRCVDSIQNLFRIGICCIQSESLFQVTLRFCHLGICFFLFCSVFVRIGCRNRVGISQDFCAGIVEHDAEAVQSVTFILGVAYD